jgi:cytochrome oxidase Cu insertion factor (SCO1/SenC/PrrC family)
LSPRSTRALLVGVPVVVVALVASLAAMIVAHAQHQPGTYRPATPDYGRAPAYTLVDQNGERVSSAEFAGKVQVVAYLFPYCTTYCPTITHTLVELQKDLAQEGLFGSRVQFVVFNVDPAGSGPAQMRAFLRQYGADPRSPGWHYLTGSLAQVRHVVHDGFHVYFRKVSLRDEEKAIAREKANGTYTPVAAQSNPLAERKHVDYDIVHNDYIEIVDTSGRITGIFDGNQASEGRLFTAVRKAAVPNG